MTHDVDTVAEQHGDDPTVVDIAIATAGTKFAGLKIDCIPVGDTAAADLSKFGLPDDQLDRAFVLAHRWAFDSARRATVFVRTPSETAVRVTCRFAQPASLVSMKLQSAPRRRAERSHMAGGDYFDIFRILSHPSLVRPMAEAFRQAPHDLGDWSIRALARPLAAVHNTVVDAVSHLRIRQIVLPLSPERVRPAIAAARIRPGP